MIEVKNITKRYGKKKNVFTALDNVSLTIEEGETVAIIGKSGSGKSTLMHVMSGLDRPQEGEVIIGGEDILKLKQKAIDKFRAHQMSFIFQSFFVQANESCLNNVSLPLEIAEIPRRERAARIDEALAAVELSDKKKSRARDLSGGQKQRLAIARAIAARPKILFADEPTGNLDSATGDVVEKLLFGYARDNGTTLIVVTHDQDLADKCDRQVYIKDGQIEKIIDRKASKDPVDSMPKRRIIAVAKGGK